MYQPQAFNNQWLIQYLLEHESLAAKIEKELSGVSQIGIDEHNCPIYRQVRKPMLNQYGINRIKLFVELFDKDVILGNNNIEEIDLTMYNVKSSLILLLMQEYKEMGAKEEDLDLIFTIVSSRIQAILKRSLNGMTIDALTANMRVIENTIPSQQQENGGFFKNLFNRMTNPSRN
jgi:hypothetical protein